MIEQVSKLRRRHLTLSHLQIGQSAYVGRPQRIEVVGPCQSSPVTPTLIQGPALIGSATDAVGDSRIVPVFRNGDAVTLSVPVVPDLVAATVVASKELAERYHVSRAW